MTCTSEAIVLYLDIVTAHSDADLSQVFEQRGHHLGHPLPLVVGHLLQLLKLRVQR